MQHLGCLIVHIELMQVRERERGGTQTGTHCGLAQGVVFHPGLASLGFPYLTSTVVGSSRPYSLIAKFKLLG